LLLIAAALLTASLHSVRVVEATSAPESAVTVTLAADRRVQPVRQGDRPTASSDSSSVAVTEQASGRRFLDDMSGLSAPELRALDQSSRAQATAFDSPPAATTVVSWWNEQRQSTRDRLVANAPYLVGNLEGVPYSVRDTANRAALKAAIHAAGAAGSGSADKAAMLGQIEGSLVQAPGSPMKQLLTLDTRGSGRAAIAIGDLQTASDLTVMVPGMFFTVTGQMEDWTATGGDIYAEQATLASKSAATSTGTAVLAWMGYRTPDLSNVLSLDLAQQGATRLDRVVKGIDAMRAASMPRVNVVAHSYGSTTALIALSSGKIHVNSLTLFGSPGSSVTSAKDLQVDKGQVFVGDAHWDPIAGTGYFGIDPGSAGFGSTVLNLAGGVDTRDDDDVFKQPFGHNDYLKPGTASLHDLALIAIGRSDLVTRSSNPGDPSDQGSGGSPQFLVVRPQDVALRD
jgi:pimeloyl-ACP methyl ester carboxylesterase